METAATDTLASLDAEAADAARLKQSIPKAASRADWCRRTLPTNLLARIAAERSAQPAKWRRTKGRNGKAS